MQMLSSKSSISPTYSISLNCTKAVGTNFQYLPVIIRSKKSNYQDFQEYAKPSRLLAAADVKVYTNSPVDKAVTSFMPSRYESLYKIKLQTSRAYGSGLTDINSGVLLCLIDENGSSILQTLPTTSDETDKLSEYNIIYDGLHFQRGSVDEFSFEGPELGRIIAVWISLESGQWRLGGISLTVISKRRDGLKYNFNLEDILLGEKSETSMAEFRPYSVTSIAEDELFNQNFSNGSSLVSDLISNDESMKEYANLKFSLLFYDVVLILSGSSIASILTGENVSYAFLTGGMFGFVYLLLLQRSVDGLPAPELVPSENKGIFGEIIGSLKGPIVSLAMVFAFVIATVKYASGDDAVKLTSKDLVFGMMGFLLCKVSVMLAAFKPISVGLRENGD